MATMSTIQDKDLQWNLYINNFGSIFNFNIVCGEMPGLFSFQFGKQYKFDR